MLREEFGSACSPVREAIGPLLLAGPVESEVQGQGGDQGVILDLLARLQGDRLGVLVDAGHGHVLTILLQAAGHKGLGHAGG